MQLRKILSLVGLSLLLTGCGTTTNSTTTTSNGTTTTSSTTTTTSSTKAKTSTELAALETEYGTFSITPETSTYESNISYDSSTNTYTIAVDADKVTYVVKGYFAGSIVIDDVNNLSDTTTGYKGVCLELQGAALVSTDGDPVIKYDVGKKNVEIKSKNGYTNHVIANGSANAIESDNNVELSGKGTLNITAAQEHAIEADGDITIYSAGTYIVTTGHDGFHGHNFYTYTDDGDVFSGTLTMYDIVSQAIEATDDTALDGLIDITGGTINVDNAESVFKTDTTLTIGADAKVVATNLTGDPVVKLDDNTKTVTITVNGTFTVDGAAYTKTSI